MKQIVSHIKNGEYNLSLLDELKQAIARLDTDFVFIYLHSEPIEWGEYAQERMLEIAESTEAGIITDVNPIQP